MRRVRSRAEAEDLTHEVIVRLLGQHSDTLRVPEAYIFRMASNLLADRARQQTVRNAYCEMVQASEKPGTETLDPYREASGREDLRRIVKVIEGLPERTRTIFVLYRIENLSQETIADKMGISVSAVKKHVARAMAALMQSGGLA